MSSITPPERSASAQSTSKHITLSTWFTRLRLGDVKQRAAVGREGNHKPQHEVAKKGDGAAQRLPEVRGANNPVGRAAGEGRSVAEVEGEALEEGLAEERREAERKLKPQLEMMKGDGAEQRLLEVSDSDIPVGYTSLFVHAMAHNYEHEYRSRQDCHLI
jgi:hypothetical protein